MKAILHAEWLDMLEYYWYLYLILEALLDFVLHLAVCSKLDPPFIWPLFGSGPPGLCRTTDISSRHGNM